MTNEISDSVAQEKLVYVCISEYPVCTFHYRIVHAFFIKVSDLKGSVLISRFLSAVPYHSAGGAKWYWYDMQ